MKGKFIYVNESLEMNEADSIAFQVVHWNWEKRDMSV